MINKTIFICVLLFSGYLNAGTINASTSITNLYTYTDSYIANDIVIEVETTKAGCEAGFWLSGNDAKENAFIPALLLSAYHTGTSVYFSALDGESNRWVGSSGSYCKIKMLGLQE